MKRSLVAAVAAVPLLIVGCVVGFLLLLTGAPPAVGSCAGSGPAVTVDVGRIPGRPVAGYGREQLINAALIMNAAQKLGLDLRAQQIGVMTAMGESSLRVVDHGDAAGPDSRGLFQQRDNGAWGSYEDRMDPTRSATMFFQALRKVVGWQTLEPTIAAHRVQRNADPYHYAKFWDAAVKVVQALAGVKVTGVPAGGADLGCTDASVQVGAKGWTKPAVGPITGVFGEDRGDHYHSGTDIAAECGKTIWAAAAGRVVQAGPVGGYGNLITLDHGGGIVTRYGHMYSSGILVHVGDKVPAGRQIAEVGNTGTSSGCHLHFEVRVRDAFVDPEAFMRAHGAPLR